MRSVTRRGEDQRSTSHGRWEQGNDVITIKTGLNEPFMTGSEKSMNAMRRETIRMRELD